MDFIVRQPPQIFAERAVFFRYSDKYFRVVYDGSYFSFRFYHVFRGHYSVDICLTVLRNLAVIEVIEACPEYIAFIQHHIPVKSALHYFHRKKFELRVIVEQRNAPFRIVVTLHFFVYRTPFAFCHKFHHRVIRDLLSLYMITQSVVKSNLQADIF